MGAILTGKQIEAYRLVSGEFQNQPTKTAAESMGISVQAFNRLLRRAEKAAPSIFPILTKQEADVKALLAIGYFNCELANQLGVSLGRISQIISSLFAKRPGLAAKSQPIKLLQYQPFMDSQIREKF